MAKLRSIFLWVIGLLLAWTGFCLLVAAIKALVRRVRHTKRPGARFWADFWWLWLEVLNPLNWF